MPTHPKVVGEPLKVYLAGPLTSDTREGIELHKTIFRGVWDRMCELGHYPYSPAGQSGHRVLTKGELETAGVDEHYGLWVKGYDFTWLSLCDAILMLPQWQKSRGAKMEFAEAQRLGLRIFYDESDVPTIQKGAKPLRPSFVSQPPPVEKRSILHEAEMLVFGDRQKQYGHPRDDYIQQAAVWTGMLQHKLKDGARLMAHEAALLMVTLKARRCIGNPSRDSLIDLAGYAEVVARIVGGDA